MKKLLLTLMFAIMMFVAVGCVSTLSETEPAELKNGVYSISNDPSKSYVFFDTENKSWSSSPSLAMSVSIGGKYEIEGALVIATSKDESVKLTFEAKGENQLELISINCKNKDLKDWWKEGDVYTALDEEAGLSLTEGRVCSADEGLSLAKEEETVVFENIVLTAGGGIWDEFYEKVNQGETATVFCVHYYSLRPENTDAESYEEEKDDYPQLYLYKLEHKNGLFEVAVRKSSESEYDEVQKYRYLKHYTGDSNPEANFSTYDYYVLVEDDAVTWEEIERGILSSQSGEDIPHFMVYGNHLD